MERLMLRPERIRLIPVVVMYVRIDKGTGHKSTHVMETKSRATMLHSTINFNGSNAEKGLKTRRRIVRY